MYPHPVMLAVRHLALEGLLAPTQLTCPFTVLQLQLLTEPRLASIEEITAVHDTDYIQQLQETIDTQAPTVVADFDDPDGFTYVTSTSFDDARKVADSVHCVEPSASRGR